MADKIILGEDIISGGNAGGKVSLDSRWKRGRSFFLRA
jgi:hypothetical protein